MGGTPGLVRPRRGCEELRPITASLEQMIARCANLGGQLVEIDIKELARTLAQLAGDHDGIDVRARNSLNDGADGVVDREDGHTVGADHDDVGLLAGSKRADRAFKPGGAGAVDSCGLQDRLDRDRRRHIRFAAETAIAHGRTLLAEQGVHFPEHVAAEGGIEIDADRRRETVIDRLLVGEAFIIEAEERVRTRIDCHVDPGLGEEPPGFLRDAGAVVEDVVRTKHALFSEFRTELGEIADEFREDAHVQAAGNLPPIKIELAEEPHLYQAAIMIPVRCEAFQIIRQVGGRGLLVHGRTDHV